jgi:Spy/CpxP family protein refolding chaperone
LPNRLRWTGLAIAVIAGLLIGFAASTLAYRYRILRVPGGNVLARMDQELHLTPAQHHQIRAIMQDTHFKVQQLHQDFRRQRHEAFMQALQQVRGILTPEQQEKFDRDFAPRGLRDHHEHGGGPPQ